ncbi:hypothetical protein STEG23_034924 [Scotinomys teguina]
MGYCVCFVSRSGNTNPYCARGDCQLLLSFLTAQLFHSPDGAANAKRTSAVPERVSYQKALSQLKLCGLVNAPVTNTAWSKMPNRGNGQLIASETNIKKLHLNSSRNQHKNSIWTACRLNLDGSSSRNTCPHQRTSSQSFNSHHEAIAAQYLRGGPLPHPQD